MPFPGSECGARRPIDTAVTKFLSSLFHTASKVAGCTLSLHDLFHAHLFHTDGVPGLLFHAMEYPVSSDAFPYYLGYCQHASQLVVDPTDMRFRNVVWLFGHDVMVLVDADARAPFGTVYESELGSAVADIFYFDAGPNRCHPNQCINRGLYIVPFM